MRAGPSPLLSSLLLASALALAAGPAAAACRCVCIQGRSVPRCGPTDVGEAICQNLCLDSVAPAPLRGSVGQVLSGGGQASDSVGAAEAPGGGQSGGQPAGAGQFGR